MTAWRQGRVARPTAVAFSVDGRMVEAPDGENLAVALACAGVWQLRESPRTGTPRGAFCFMGVCQECLVAVDGAPRQACRVPVRAGMRVRLGLAEPEATAPGIVEAAP